MQNKEEQWRTLKRGRLIMVLSFDTEERRA